MGTRHWPEDADDAFELIEEERNVLKLEAKEYRFLIDKLSELLTDIASTVKGTPTSVEWHSYHDLPKIVKELKEYNDELINALNIIENWKSIRVGMGENPIYKLEKIAHEALSKYR